MKQTQKNKENIFILQYSTLKTYSTTASTQGQELLTKQARRVTD